MKATDPISKYQALSFRMALKQSPNVMQTLVNYKTRELRFYDKVAGKLDRLSTRAGLDISLALDEGTNKFGMTLQHRKNPAISSFIEKEHIPQTKNEMKGMFKVLKNEVKRLKVLFKIDKKFTKSID